MKQYPVGSCYVDVDVDDVVHYGPWPEHRQGTQLRNRMWVRLH